MFHYPFFSEEGVVIIVGSAVPGAIPVWCSSHVWEEIKFPIGIFVVSLLGKVIGTDDVVVVVGAHGVIQTLSTNLGVNSVCSQDLNE